MNSPASQKPSERRWRRRLTEAVIALLLLTAFSLWLSRDMLPRGITAPAETLPRLTSEQATPNGQLIWPSSADKTLVYFFAPWCAVCRVSMPSLNLLSRDGVRVVAVALDWQSQEDVRDFIERSGYQGAVLLGNADVAQRWQIDAYPSYYVISRDGHVLHRDRGLSTPPGLLLRTL